MAAAPSFANMPFCVHCGQPVAPADVFCGHCGSRQASPSSDSAPPPPPPPSSASSGITSSQASVFSYTPFVGWLFSIFVLATDQFRAQREVRFHAFQGLYLFVAYLIADRVLEPIFRPARLPLNPGSLVEAAAIFTGLYLMYQTSQGALVRIPLLGELAEKSVTEQNR